MVKWFFLFLFGGLATIAVSLYFKLGAYKDVQVQIKTVDPMHLIYKKHFGGYHKISSVIDVVESWALKNDVECFESFGLYIDDPKSTDEDRLRSEGGCVTRALLPEAQLPVDFGQKKIESKEYIVAEFDGSPAIGPFVVYPRANEWAEQNRIKIIPPTIESYKVEGQKVITTYYFNIER